MRTRSWVVVGLVAAVGAGVTGGGCSFADPVGKTGDSGAGADGALPPVGSGDASLDVSAPPTDAKPDSPPPGDGGDAETGPPVDAGDAAPPACAPVDGKRCASGSSTTLETCAPSGAWVAGACPAATPRCKTDACVETCTPGAKRCKGNDVETCASDGTWGAAVACAAPKPFCNGAGECETGITCTAGNTRCNANSVETCVGGDSWSPPVACPAATPACGPIAGQPDGTCGILECTPGAPGCLANSTRTCKPDSRWGPSTACPAATPACDPPGGGGPGTCGVIECTPGNKECPTSSSTRTCQADSRWGAAADCPAATPLCAAASGTCVACAAGAAACRDPRTPQTCSAAGAWVPSAACAVGSECKPATSTCGLCASSVAANDWTLVAPVGGTPPARSNARMAADPSDGSVLLFGGMTGYVSGGGDTLTNDTWRLTGAVWTALNPATKPSARQNHAMATNPTNGKVYLFGGQGPSPGYTYNNELWEWNGATWTQLCTAAPCSATKPSARTAAALAFDVERNRLVLAGGLGSGGAGAANDTWEWDGAAWTQKCGGALASCGFAPMHELFGGGAYDSVRKRTAFLITDDTNGGAASRLYEYDGVRWTLATGNTTPPFPGGSYGAVMANVYDPVRKVLVSLGHPGEFDFRVWEWNGACWSNTSPVAASHGARGQATAYDRTNSRIVRFGGSEPKAGGGLTFHSVLYERSSL